jgi:hypothetical protein
MHFLLKDFIVADLFPEDIRVSCSNPFMIFASSCADDDLMRVLRRYDENPGDMVLVEQVPEGNCLPRATERVFRKGKKLRKRVSML